MRTKRKQVVVKLKGDRGLLERVLDIVEQRTQGIVSNVMDNGKGDCHAFITVFEVYE